MPPGGMSDRSSGAWAPSVCSTPDSLFTLNKLRQKNADVNDHI